MNASPERSDQDMQALISAYLEGSLSPGDEDRLNDWLRQDPRHQDEFIQQLFLHGALRSSTPKREGSSFRRTRHEAGKKPLRRPRLRGLHILAACAAGALLALGGYLLRPTQAPVVPKREARGEKAMEAPPPGPKTVPEPLPTPDLPKPPAPAAPDRAPETPAPAPTIERTPDPPPGPAPSPAKPVEPPKESPAPAEPPRRAPEPSKPTLTAIATLAEVGGSVRITSSAGGEPVAGAAGHDLTAGSAIETKGEDGRAVIRWADGTRLELGAQTLVSSVSEGTGKVNFGKRVDLVRGVVAAQVARQPAGRPMILVTPHGEARVLGTTLRLTVTPGDTGSTRLEVTEGKVRLKRLQDGRTVDVVTGHYAVAASGAELAPAAFPSLLAHWKLDDERGKVAVDSSVHRNDGTYFAENEPVPGKFGRAWHNRGTPGFQASLQYMGSYSGRALTVALWVFQDDLGSRQDGLFGWGGLNVIREGNMDPGRIRVILATDEGSALLTFNGFLRANQWVHTAITWDGSDLRLYRNGKSLGETGKVSGTLKGWTEQALRIGNSCHSRLDDVRIYRRALSPQELQIVAGGGDVR